MERRTHDSNGIKISIAMATYNGGRFLREQLDSIFAQSRLPDELVVCDDQSTDDTLELLRDYAARAPFRMTVIANDERLGSTKNFEKAITSCSGEVIALCDQDDIWRPHKLAVFEQTFAADSQLGVVLTNADLIDEDSATIRGDLWSRCMFTRARQKMLAESRRYDLLLGFPFATGATMAFRSRFKPLILPMPTEAPTFIHDRWIAVLIAAVSRIAIIPEKLISYRLHPHQQLGVGKAPLLRRLFDPYRCRSDAAALAALEQRLKEYPSPSVLPDFRDSLAQRQRHIAARSSFSQNSFRRLEQVASEFGSGRYNRYPFGLRSSIKDWLVGTR